MKKILKAIRRLFRVSYRVTTIRRGKVENVYCNTRRQAKGILRRMPDAEYWSVYKAGPMYLPEREVDCGKIK